MKRLIALAVAASFAVLVAAAFAGDEHAGHKHGSTTAAANKARPAQGAGAPAAAKSGTWTGEILDAGCYLGNGAMGPKHAECALKCAANGMPLMLLTKEGRAVLLTPNHDNPDAYEAVKKLAGSMAVITGSMNERGGVRGIDVTGAKSATAAAN
jgi:hypothetical protein